MTHSYRIDFKQVGWWGNIKNTPVLHIASWCNGSTADFGSACLGSNPDEATQYCFKSLSRDYKWSNTYMLTTLAREIGAIG